MSSAIQNGGMMSFEPISYRRLFPWTRLVEAIGMALSLRQMLVAAVATCVVMVAGMLSDPAPRTIPPLIIPGWNISLPMDSSATPALHLHRRLDLEFLSPWWSLLQSVLGILSPRASIQDRLLHACHGLWQVALWSLFGLILSRLASRQFTRHEDASFRKSVQFGMTRWLQAIVGPLLPAAAATVIVFLALVIALPGRLPLIGETLGWVASPLIVAFSLGAAYLVIAMLLGWPLMVAAIATDDCDGFGAFSRSYSFWTGKSWYFVWCWIVAYLIGTFAMLLALWLAMVALCFSELIISTSIGPVHGAASVSSATFTILGFLLRTFAISFFWTTATIVYILLRQSVDQMPLDHSAPDDDEREPRDPLPVVGMPAMR